MEEKWQRWSPPARWTQLSTTGGCSFRLAKVRRAAQGKARVTFDEDVGSCVLTARMAATSVEETMPCYLTRATSPSRLYGFTPEVVRVVVVLPLRLHGRGFVDFLIQALPIVVDFTLDYAEQPLTMSDDTCL